MAKLSDIFDLQMGKTPARANSDYWNSGTNSWVSIADLSSYEKYVGETKEKITDIAVRESGIKAVPPNTVIMSFKLSLGKTAIAKNAVYTNEAIMAFIPNGRYNISPEYFFYMLSERDWSKGTNRAVMGATLNKATLGEINVTVPPIGEQRYVASVLDKLTGLISLRKQQLAKLDEVVKARFVEMFGDPMRNPSEWPIHQLQEYILFLTSGSRGWAQYFTNSGEYFITIKNVKNCRVTLDDVQYVIPPNDAEAKRTKVEEGDLLISITADLGRTGVITKEIADYGAYINQHLTCIRLDRKALHPLYVAYYMESEAGKTQFRLKNQNGVKAGLNFNAINSLNLMVPPLERQNYFVDFVAKMERQKLTIQQSLDKLEVLRKSLMQEYFG